jgi:uncharacterized protein YdaU (DUF1376 family)
MKWYKFNVADYLETTKEIPDAEDLAFRRMIDLYYMREGPLTLDHHELEQQVGLDWDCIEPILRDFFRATPEGYVNDALQIDLEKWVKKAALNKKNGAKGGRPPKA